MRKSSSLWVPQALLEVQVLGGGGAGRLFVGNRSAVSAELAGGSITSAVSHPADIDQVPASGTHLLRVLESSGGSVEIHNACGSPA